MGEGSRVIFSLFGFLPITGEVVTMFIILFIVTIISLIVKLNLKERPGKFQNMIEVKSIHQHVLSLFSFRERNSGRRNNNSLLHQ